MSTPTRSRSRPGPSWPTSSTRSSRRPARSASSSRRRGARTSRTCSATPRSMPSWSPRRRRRTSTCSRAPWTPARRCSARSRSTSTSPASTRAVLGSGRSPTGSCSASTAGSTRRSPTSAPASQAGEIGTLEQLTIISRDPAPPPAGYVATSGGLFRDMTIHDFDMARFFLGDVVEVSATGSNLVSPEIAEAGDIDGAVVVLRGAGGALCSITNSRRCAFGYDQRLEAFGERGSLSAANQLPTSVRFSGARAHRGRAAVPQLLPRPVHAGLPGGAGRVRHRRRAGRRLLARLRRRPRGPGAGRRGEREPADRRRREGRCLRGARTGRWWPSPRRRSRRCSAARRAPRAWRP